MSFIINNGCIDGEIEVGNGLGSRLRFRGRIFNQRFTSWTEIHGFKHIRLSHEESHLGKSSLWGNVDAFLRDDGILEHQYPKHEQLIVGTFCRYARQIGISVLGAETKFQTNYDNVRGLVIIKDNQIWDSSEKLQENACRQ